MDGLQQSNRPKNKYLWKYLDLMKFLDFIETKELFFARMDTFDDIFEMSSSEQLEFIYFTNMMASSSPDTWNSKNPEDDIQIFKKGVLQGIFEMRKLQRNYFASCFYNSDAESIAMWNLYSRMDGLAIRFDAQKLFDYIYSDHKMNEKNRSFSLYSSNIEYFNPDEIITNEKKGDIMPIKFYDYSPFKKSLYYQHEIEYRFVFDDCNNVISGNPNKKCIRVKLENLIDLGVTFFVSSETEEWQISILEKIIQSHVETNFRIQKSQILTKRNIMGYMEDYTNQKLKDEEEAWEKKYGDEYKKDS